MAETCACSENEVVEVDVHGSLLAENDRAAGHNREHFTAARIFTVNLMGSPGSGKTAILEATASALGGGGRFRAVSGDLATERDAARLRAAGVRAATITTGSACHLDARQVHDTLRDLFLRGADFFFIENVGNLVCPAIYDLGETARVVTLSVTEGDDKPLKYPVMFHRADLVLLTKVDLLPHLPGFSVERFEEALDHVMPAARMIEVSAISGSGLDHWVAWLEAAREQALAAA